MFLEIAFRLDTTAEYEGIEVWLVVRHAACRISSDYFEMEWIFLLLFFFVICSKIHLITKILSDLNTTENVFSQSSFDCASTVANTSSQQSEKYNLLVCQNVIIQRYLTSVSGKGSLKNERASHAPQPCLKPCCLSILSARLSCNVVLISKTRPATRLLLVGPCLHFKVVSYKSQPLCATYLLLSEWPPHYRHPEVAVRSECSPFWSPAFGFVSVTDSQKGPSGDYLLCSAVKHAYAVNIW